MPGRCRSATRGHRSSPGAARSRDATRSFTRQSCDGASQHDHRKNNRDGAHGPADTLRFVNVTSMSLEPFVRGLNQLPIKTDENPHGVELRKAKLVKSVALIASKSSTPRSSGNATTAPVELIVSINPEIRNASVNWITERSQRSPPTVTSERFVRVSSIRWVMCVCY